MKAGIFSLYGASLFALGYLAWRGYRHLAIKD